MLTGGRRDFRCDIRRCDYANACEHDRAWVRAISAIGADGIAMDTFLA
jgi:hypothetical protein